MAGTRFGTAAEAAEARAPPGVTLRPLAPFSGAAEADEGGGDWSFIDCEMEEVDLQDLPSATIACHLDPRVFVDGLCRVRAGRGGPPGGGRTLVAGRTQRRDPGRPGAASPCPGRRRGGEATPGAAATSWAALPRSSMSRLGWGHAPRGPGPLSTCRAARTARPGGFQRLAFPAGNRLPATPLP